MDAKVALCADPEAGLTLRKVLNSDLSLIAEWLKDRELVRLAFGVTQLSESEHRSTCEYYMRMVASPHPNFKMLIIGDQGLEPLGIVKYDQRIIPGVGKVAFAGIMLGRLEACGRALGSRALLLLERYLFEEAHFDLIELETADYNLAAQRSFHKCGFRDRESLYSLQGIENYGLGPLDAPKIYMALSKEEYRERQEGQA